MILRRRSYWVDLTGYRPGMGRSVWTRAWSIALAIGEAIAGVWG